MGFFSLAQISMTQFSSLVEATSLLLICIYLQEVNKDLLEMMNLLPCLFVLIGLICLGKIHTYGLIIFISMY